MNKNHSLISFAFSTLAQPFCLWIYVILFKTGFATEILSQTVIVIVMMLLATKHDGRL